MIKNKRGFTLIELIIVIFILSLILVAIFSSYQNILMQYKQSIKQTQFSIQTVIDLNLLRLDVEHAGFGLASNLDNKPIEIPDNNKIIIRSTFNATNLITSGWITVYCDTSLNWNVLAESEDYTFYPTTKLVFLRLTTKQFVANGNYGTCPEADDYFLGFPYFFNGSTPQNGCGKTPPASGEQFCNIIEYSLSSNQNIKSCNPYTKNLLRRIGGEALNNIGGAHILDCVADFKVYVDYDLNGDDKIEDSERNISIPLSDNSTLIREKLKSVNIYILAQLGKKDLNYIYNGNVNNGKIDFNGIELSLPNNYEHYRWKVIFFKINPKLM